MSLYWSLSGSKSPQLSRTLLSIVAVLHNAVVWMVSTHPPTSKSPSLFNNPFVIVPKATITISPIISSMFHSFFQFPSEVEVLILLFTFFQFYSVVSWGSKVDNFANSLFLFLIVSRSGLLAEIRWSVCISNPVSVHVCHFLGQMLCCAYIIICKVFTSVLADGLLLEDEWLRISSGHQIFSLYSDRS